MENALISSSTFKKIHKVSRVFPVQTSVVDRGRHGGDWLYKPDVSAITGDRWGRSWMVLSAAKEVRMFKL